MVKHLLLLTLFFFQNFSCFSLTIIKIKNKSDSLAAISLIGGEESSIVVAAGETKNDLKIVVPRSNANFVCIKNELSQYLQVVTKKSTFLIAEGHHIVGQVPSGATWMQYMTFVKKKKNVLENIRNTKLLVYSYGFLDIRDSSEQLCITMIIQEDGMLDVVEAKV